MAATVEPSHDSIAIGDVEIISSYNCIGSDSRTIVVPGMPAKWLARTDTPHLKPDCGARILDYNAGQWPEAPIDPGIQAVLHLQPKFDFTQLDVISDRRRLACILELAVRKGAKIDKAYEGDERTESFRFGAQVIGQTLVFVRTDPVELQEIDKFRGFADEFKNTYLEYPEGMTDSKSHHRMATSRLGDLRILLRHNAEGYVADGSPELKEAFDKDMPLAGEECRYDNITVKSGGALIPRSAMLELNTCSKNHNSDSRLNAKARECWLSQDAHFVIAKHTVTLISKKMARRGNFTSLRGTFTQNDIRFHNVADDTSEWDGEGKVIEDFHELLVDLVQRIQAAAADGHGETYMVEYVGKGMDIGISPRDDIRALSTELSERVRTGGGNEE